MAGATGWRYSTVALTFWNDLKVRSWPAETQRVGLYLLTCPHRAPEGFYHLPVETAAADLDLPAEELRERLARLMGDDFVEVDEKARLVLIVKGLKYAPTVRGPASIKGALNALDRAQGSPRLFARFLEGADAYQPDLAAAIRSQYRLPEGPYQDG